MKDGVCPKCASSEIRIPPPQEGFIYMEKTLSVPQWKPLPGVQVYICIQCGYFEEYLENLERLAYLAVHWNRVDTPKRG